jgi:type I restriction enzyme S subunit
MKNGWGQKKLKDLCVVDWGNTGLTKSSYVDGGKYLAVSAAGCDGRINHAEHKKHTPVLSAIGAHCGRMFYPKEDFTAIKNTITLTPRQDICEGKFLYYLFSFIELPKRGAGQPFISKGDIESFSVSIPESLLEQKQITAILDATDAMRAKRRETIALLDTLLQSTFSEMFGDPLTNPKGWKVKKLKEISTHILSGTTPKGGKQVYSEEGIVFFRSQNVWRNTLVLDDVVHIDRKTHQKMKKSSLKNKDILMTKTGRINTENSSLGRAAIFLGDDDSANINGHVYLIRLQNSAFHRFILYILTTNEYKEYIRRICVGAIDKRQINKEHLEEFPIIFPPLELQRRFATIIESVEHQKALHRTHLAELDTLFASLQQRAFNGELS